VDRRSGAGHDSKKILEHLISEQFGGRNRRLFLVDDGESLSGVVRVDAPVIRADASLSIG
jgi:hypothetical protein